MNRTPVASSSIKSIGYESEVLEVEFQSGTLYQYSSVPQGMFERFVAAPSKGRFFDQFIRDKYRTRKIG
jgi:hypothetical protein